MNESEKKSWYRIYNTAEPNTVECLLYDDIGMWGISAKQFTEDFSAINADHINLRINSGGGECFDGFAICAAIQEHPAKVHGIVTGLAASIASVIAISCDDITIAKNGWMMAHKAWSGCVGTGDDLRREASLLDGLDKQIVGIYAGKSGRSADEWEKMIADEVEVWMNADRAKQLGLADMIQTDDPDPDDPDEVDRAQGEMLRRAVGKFRRVPNDLKTRAALRSQGAAARKVKPAASTAGKENRMSKLNVISRDGRQFVKIGDAEHEIDPIAPLTDGAAKPLTQADMDRARNEGRDAAVAYEAMFQTVQASANLTGEAAANFRKQFYGRSAADLKFLAEHSIGERARPVGEGGAGGGGGGAADAPELAAVVADATKRFGADRKLRRMMRCNSDDPNSTAYKGALAKFVNGSVRNFEDARRPKVDLSQTVSGDDPIDRLSKRPGVFELIS